MPVFQSLNRQNLRGLKIPYFMFYHENAGYLKSGMFSIPILPGKYFQKESEIKKSEQISVWY